MVVLHQYNTLGEEEYTAVDVNKNGRIDLAGPDRVTRAVSDYAQRDGYTVQRHQSFEWPEFGQAEPRLASTRETTLNAEKATLTWDIRYGLTNLSRVDFPGNGARVATTIAPDGSQSVSVYQEGRLLDAVRRDATGAALGRTTFEYDPHGRQAFASDARNGRTGYEYNGADQPVRVTTPPPAEGQPPQVTQTQYDAMGRVFTVTYPDQATVTNEYHPTGALKAKYGARTYPVAYTYDPQGRMQTMTTWGDFAKNAGARVTTWQYHPQRGWLTAKLYPDQKGPSYDYWPSGKIKTRQWVRDIATNYRYDESGRVKNVDYTDTNTPPVAYAYDRLGRPSKITQGDSVTERAYGPAGQMLGESYTGGPLDGLTVANAYDAYLRRTNLLARSTSPGGKKKADDAPLAATWYGYDAASRLQTVSDGQYAAEYHYLANSPLVEQIAYRNGEVLRMTTLKKHDHLNRLESIESQPSTDKRIAYTYRYNLANQRTNAVLADNTAWNYGYDDLGQLTNGVKMDPQSKPVDSAAFQYSYDTIGNRKSTVSAGVEVDYQVDALNRYTNAVAVARGGDGKPTDPNSISLRTGSSQYDADGNLKSDANWVYTWDAENRLIAMETGAGVSPANRKRLEFQYDTQSRRIAKRVYTWTADRKPLTSGSWSLVADLRFVYEGWNLIAEFQSTSSNLNSEISNLRSYLWGLDLSGSLQGAGGVGGLLAVADHSSQTAHHFVNYDGNGNVVSLVDAASGTVSDHYEYDPFGNEITPAKGHSLTNPFRFSTKYSDEETGLVYYGYRYYSPATGKWVSRDPIEESGDNQLYCFARNSALNYIDAHGLAAMDDVFAAMGRIEDFLIHNQAAVISGLYQMSVNVSQTLGNINRFTYYTSTTTTAEFEYPQIWNAYTSTMRIQQTYQDSDVFHEAVHARNYYVNHLTDYDRVDEGVAYLAEAHLAFIRQEDVLEKAFSQPNPCAQKETFRRNWKLLWAQYGKVKDWSQVAWQYPEIGMESTQEMDFNNLHKYYNVGISAETVANILNGKSIIAGCCFQFTCGSDAGNETAISAQTVIDMRLR
nr:RHS repeat-associated core domain-containing protein [uncultured Methanoregula sp.]